MAPLFVAWRRTLPGFQNFSLESPSFDSIDLEHVVLWNTRFCSASLSPQPCCLPDPASLAWCMGSCALGNSRPELYPLVLLGRDYLLPDRSPAFLSPYNTVLNEWTLTWIRHPP